MKRKEASVGRAYLVKRLMARCGLSRRQSVAVVNVILERMIHHLRRGHRVEFPYGELQREKRWFGEWWDANHDWPANRDPYTIEYRMTEEGARELYGWDGEAKKRGGGK